MRGLGIGGAATGMDQESLEALGKKKAWARYRLPYEKERGFVFQRNGPDRLTLKRKEGTPTQSSGKRRDLITINSFRRASLPQDLKSK